MANIIKLSKFLSYVLRHKPEKIGISLDANGWTNVSDFLFKANLDLEALKEVVSLNNKERFEFNEDETKIRARQGHSVKVDLGYKPQKPPEFLYHGTSAESYVKIKKSGGLNKMKRHAVHLSQDLATAVSVGQRNRATLMVLKVCSGEMHKLGMKFYKTENNVWLTEEVPTKFLKEI